MPKPHFAIAVTFNIKSEFIEQFRARVIQQARDSVSKEPGCNQFDVLQDETDPVTIHLYETYRDPEAFDDHKKTDHFRDFDHTVAGWIASKHVRRLTMLDANHGK
jgi:(4S)-4-hydroxy-5-phosphonooxypentane-2,3-dione isomerase